MTSNTQKRLTTPSSNAVAAVRESDHQLLTQIDGVGDELATALLDAFGSQYGVQRAATNHWSSLVKVKGISEAAAAEFRDRMEKAGALRPAHRASADAVRRAHRAEIHQRVKDGSTGQFTIVGVGQVVAGIAVPALRFKLEPVAGDYDPPSGETPILTTRVPQGTQAYRAYLEYLELPSNAWECTPIEVCQQYRDRIERRALPFRYQDGFVVELHDGHYHI
jgi:hypothetical protein